MYFNSEKVGAILVRILTLLWVTICSGEFGGATFSRSISESLDCRSTGALFRQAREPREPLVLSSALGTRSDPEHAYVAPSGRARASGLQRCPQAALRSADDVRDDVIGGANIGSETDAYLVLRTGTSDGSSVKRAILWRVDSDDDECKSMLSEP